MARFYRPLLIGIGLGVLIGANLAFDVLLIRFGEHVDHESVLHVGLGIFVSQMILAGLWIGLGDGRWYVRLTFAIAWALLAAYAMRWGAAPGEKGQSHIYDRSAIVAFIFIAMLLVAALVGFWLRRLWGWRLTWYEAASAPATRQFQLGDILLWMVVIGGALGAVKFLLTIDESFPDEIFELCAYTAGSVCAVAAAMVAASANGRPLRTAIVLVAVTVAIGMAVAAPEVYSSATARAAAIGPVALGDYVSNAMSDGARLFFFTVGTGVGGLGNCLVLRGLGGTLRRSGSG